MPAIIWLALKGRLNPVSSFPRAPDKVVNSSKLLFFQTKKKKKKIKTGKVPSSEWDLSKAKRKAGQNLHASK